MKLEKIIASCETENHMDRIKVILVNYKKSLAGETNRTLVSGIFGQYYDKFETILPGYREARWIDRMLQHGYRNFRI